MGAILVFMIKASICMAIFYTFYYFVLRKETGFVFIRVYLLSSILFAILLPFNSFSINAGLPENIQTTLVNTSHSVNELSGNNNANGTVSTVLVNSNQVTTPLYIKIILNVYLIISLLILARFLIALVRLGIIFRGSEKSRADKICYNYKIDSSFTFFRYIIINPLNKTDYEIKHIIQHEKIHASQLHSIDLLMIELLTAVMWFNPFVWMMRKSLQQVHEYLADEGVLKSGINMFDYQSVLINQVAEERYIGLSSGFNHSLIKKRIIMMTKIKKNRWAKIKMLLIVPITVALFFAISCANGQNAGDSLLAPPPPPPPPPLDEQNTLTAVAPTKMNILYVGVDNPVTIAVAGIVSNNVTAEVDNGTIKGEKGVYIINPSMANKVAVVTVRVDNQIVKKEVFRVKLVPDPVAKLLNIKSSGAIDRDLLLKQEGIVAELENFDFDISFRVVEFTVSCVIDGFSKEEVAISNKFTPQQKDLFAKVKTNGKVYIENIKAQGPDGAIRKLGAITVIVK